MEKAILQFVASLAITIIAFLLTYFFTRKPKLRFFYSAVTEIPLPSSDANAGSNGQQQKIFVRSHTVVITNLGNATAHNVRIGHLILPEAFTVSPPMNIPFNESNPKNEILIPTLTSKETVTISYLYGTNLHFSQTNAYIKCDEGVAEITNLQHVSVKSPFLKWLLGLIFFIGVVAVVFLVIKTGFFIYKMYVIVNG